MCFTRKWSGERHSWQPKNMQFFSREKSMQRILQVFFAKTIKREKFWIFCVNNLRVFIASAKGASETENFRLFRRKVAYDVLFFKFHGGGVTSVHLVLPWGHSCPDASNLAHVCEDNISIHVPLLRTNCSIYFRPVLTTFLFWFTLCSCSIVASLLTGTD